MAYAGMRLRAVLAANIRHYRLQKEWSQEHLAHAAGITSAYISALERQVSAASIDVVERIAKALDVEPTDLLAKPEPRRRGE